MNYKRKVNKESLMDNRNGADTAVDKADRLFAKSWAKRQQTSTRAFIRRGAAGTARRAPSLYSSRPLEKRLSSTAVDAEQSARDAPKILIEYF